MTCRGSRPRMGLEARTMRGLYRPRLGLNPRQGLGLWTGQGLEPHSVIRSLIMVNLGSSVRKVAQAVGRPQPNRSARREATSTMLASAPGSSPVPLTVHVGSTGTAWSVYGAVPPVSSVQMVPNGPLWFACMSPSGLGISDAGRGHFTCRYGTSVEDV